MSTLLSFWTVFSFVFFVGVLVWVIFIKRKEDFDDAAQIPFTEDSPPEHRNNTREINNG